MGFSTRTKCFLLGGLLVGIFLLNQGRIEYWNQLEKEQRLQKTVEKFTEKKKQTQTNCHRYAEKACGWQKKTPPTVAQCFREHELQPFQTSDNYAQITNNHGMAPNNLQCLCNQPRATDVCMPLQDSCYTQVYKSCAFPS